MIKNYLRSAWRNIARHKFISFVNIFGLTVGITCCLLILTYVFNELSYDKFNPNADRTYRVTRTFYTQDGTESLHLSAVAPPFGPLLKTAFPDIEKVSRLLPNGTIAVRYNEKMFNETNSFFADENFQDIFKLDVTRGDPKTGLTEPYNVMMTEAMARKYFGDQDPINQVVLLDNLKHGFKVTGIFKPLPNNSHMHAELLMSFNTLKDSTVYGEKQLRTNYGNNSFYTYLLLPKGYNAERINGQLSPFLDKYVQFKGMPAGLKTSKVTKLTLQKLTDIHLRSHLDDEIENNGNITRVYIFSIIALFILLIACINYMNLSTARSALRAKEIGIRKVIGAQRQEIIRQFLSESVLITWVALVLAIGISALVLPYVNSVSGLTLSLSSLLSWKVIILIVLLPFIVGLISGIYPAIFMSSFKPVRVLKGLVKSGAGGISFRKVLVVLQFSISIILIVATTVVFRQLSFIQNKSLGFNKDYVVNMFYNGNLNNTFDSFREELLKNPAIKEVGRSSRVPSGRLLDDQNASVMQGDSLKPIKLDLKYVTTDYGFIPTYGIKLDAGRNFSRAYVNDTTNFIINEAAVQMLQWKNAQNAIGKDMMYGNVKGKVIGVVNDFHFESLHQKIIPLLFAMPPVKNNQYNYISVKVDGRNAQSAITTMESVWRHYLPESPFAYTFLDKKFERLYSSEQLQGRLVTIFSCIAIFIACLGLFGLSAFTISQRVKEIGVRKVLGASVPRIVIELSKDFLMLVLIAAVIALPIAWYSMNKWLLDFAFRISLSWWIFAMAGVIALIIAFVTISFQSVKAAIANPVKSLRSE
ncbi:ABC transporter permease [Mucilaginibacter boryungensis]|uniref:ABC transporter permease n=1 Tax=Mucilaginibacter boryungensis TaxID=768480 RepID=A0ABR9XI87_9SPHI|nr:ABC transporter permease [Mucilaginibacter boryungensis]MBE9666935.1 ABC transporter permease [Mucilaginibacter boryungensis]